ncbi:MAG: hypothetical protein ACE1ZW_03410, partial [Nitrospirales bacterium]
HVSVWGIQLHFLRNGKRKRPASSRVRLTQLLGQKDVQWTDAIRQLSRHSPSIMSIAQVVTSRDLCPP